MTAQGYTDVFFMPPLRVVHKQMSTSVKSEDGQKQGDRFLSVSKYKYKYNGKEYQDELGLNMYDMDMRQYDPAIGRWVVQDPIVHHSASPYSAFDNNPVIFADPSGADADYINGESVGADGLTNSQWMTLSRPGGGGFDAMRAQARSNFNYLTNQQNDAQAVLGQVLLDGQPCVGDECDPTVLDYIVAEDLKAVALSLLIKSGDQPGTLTVFKLLFDFAQGSGKGIYHYGQGDSFADQYLQGRIIKELENVVNFNLNKGNYILGEDSKKYTNKKITFSPDTAGLLKSLKKHTNSNLVQLFIGGAVVDFQIKNGYIEGVIKNDTSRSSLYLHIADDYLRDSQGNGVILSTIKQYIHFKSKVQFK